MVRNAEQTATSAEQSQTNSPGYCLQWSRERATIGALQPDAATAWAHAFNRHKGDRKPPRGAMVYWTGGSDGYGHIAVSLGNGKIRSTDSGGSGRPATVDLGWPEAHWGLTFAGWADNVNDVSIPGVENGKDDDMPYTDWPQKDQDALADDVAKRVWKYLLMGVDGESSGRHADATLSEVLNLSRRITTETGA